MVVCHDLYCRTMIRPKGTDAHQNGIGEMPAELSRAVCLLRSTETYIVKGVMIHMSETDVPVWERYTLTIEEASKYFRIGTKKLRRIAEENRDSNWVIMNGNRLQIKRKMFEKIIDTLDVI